MGNPGLVDEKGVIVLHNKRFCELLDIPEEFMAQGPTIDEMFAYQEASGEFSEFDKQTKKYLHDWNKPAAGRVAFNYERRRPNGTVLSVWNNPTPSGGHVRTYLDVTEARRIEVELGHQRTLLQTALDKMEHGILVMDKNDRIVLYNDRVCELLDTPPSYFDTQPTNPEFWQRQSEMGEFSTLPPAQKAELDNWVDTKERRMLSGYERMRPNNTHLWIVINPLPNGGLVETYMDITERRRAEIELRRQLDLQRTLVETMPVPVYLMDAERRFTACNEAFADLFGVTEDRIKGKSAADVFPSSVARTLNKSDARMIRSGGTLREEVRVARPDSASRDIVVHRAAFAEPGGSPGGIVGVMTDISHETEARERLEHAKRVAEEASQSKSSFVASISHEIRTPLNGIAGFLELLSLGDLDTDQRRMVDAANLAASALNDIIGDVLDFSKIEAGHLDINPMDTEPRQVVGEVIVLMEQRANENGTRLLTQIWPDLPTRIVVDPIRLRQLLVNIIGNAVKFTRNGVVHLDVRTTTGRDGRDELRCEVFDTGVGFDSAHERNLFDEFSQVDQSSTRQFGGTGLGLAICKRLIELMDGAIDYYAEPDKGAVFWFTVPISKHHSDVEQSSPAGHDAYLIGSGAMAKRTESILRDKDITVTRPHDDTIVLSRETDSVVVVAPNAETIMLPIIRSRTDSNNVVLVVPEVDYAAKRQALCAGYTHILSCADMTDVLAAFATQTERKFNHTSDEVHVGATSRFVEHLDPTLANKPILVIDDIEMNRAVAAQQLDKLGLRYELASDGEHGLQQAMTKEFAIILVDVSMPVMDGHEFTARYRELEQAQQPSPRRVPVIAMTANAAADDEARCLEAGMDDYMAKPVLLGRMAAMIKKWIGIQDDGRISEKNFSDMPVEAVELNETKVEATTAPGSPIDFTTIHRLIGTDDPKIICRLLETFLSSFDAVQERIDAALAVRDASELHEAAHAAKGTARQGGASHLSPDFPCAPFI